MTFSCVVDFKTKTLVSKKSHTGKWRSRLDQFVAHPTKDEFFRYAIWNRKDMTAKVIRLSFETGKELQKTALFTLEKDGRYPRPKEGRMFIDERGNTLLITQIKKHIILDANRLQDKPGKSKSFTPGYLRKLNQDFSMAFVNPDKTGGETLISTKSKMPKKQSWPNLFNYRISFLKDRTTVSLFTGNKILFYDIASLNKTNEIELFSSGTKIGSYHASKQGDLLFVHANNTKSIFDGHTGQKLFDLMGDDEYLEKAKKFFEKDSFSQVISILEKISEGGRSKPEFLDLAFKSHGRLGDAKTAASYLLKLGSKISGSDYYEVIKYYALGGYPAEAIKHLKEVQQYDIRKTAEGLTKSDFAPSLKDREDFKKLVTQTKKLDDMGSLSEIPSQELFNNNIGLFELYLAKGYGILKNYKDHGLDNAIKKANASFTMARSYADLGSNRAVCYDAMGSAYLKIGKSLEAITEFENGIYEDNRTRYSFVELAAAYLDVRGIIGDELRPKKQVFWPSVLYKDYKNCTKRGTELLEEYVKEHKSDPLGYYLLAQYQFGLKYDYFQKRMMHARTAARLFKEKELQVPSFCTLMQDKYFGARVVVSTNTQSDCHTKCGTCHGKGLEASSNTCSSCNGSGFKGSCYACNGRGRKYFTSNIQFCHTCSGKGRIACYMCNGIGKKHSHNHCSTCSGSGYHCD